MQIEKREIDTSKMKSNGGKVVARRSPERGDGERLLVVGDRPEQNRRQWLGFKEKEMRLFNFEGSMFFQ